MPQAALSPETFKLLPADGERFEDLVCMLLENMKYRILEKPARGVDGGRDILAERSVKDAMAERLERVVVQCKHKAHSGQAVSDSDVPSVDNPMNRFNADGYLLVTDTRLTENLARALRGVNKPRWADSWNGERLIGLLNGHKTVRNHFFPDTIDPELPDGWVWIDAAFLSSRKRKLEKTELLRYFDGRIPSWEEALSTEIPRREFVGTIVNDFASHDSSIGPSAILIAGPGGEGKSTILRQVVCQLVEAERRILWHEDAETPVPVDWIRDQARSFVVATDDADLCSDSLFRCFKSLHESGRRDIEFILAARLADWYGSRARVKPWESFGSVREMPVAGLTRKDAESIVAAWMKLDDGLGRLVSMDLEAATNELLANAQQEARHSGGAFLGAMLRSRFGKDLDAHVKTLLERLHARDGAGTAASLLHSFAFVVAPHAENILNLTKDQLAIAIGCSARDIKEKVIAPLGEEAAYGPSGKSILTRHRAIAESATKLLSTEFGIDMDEVLADLARAAISLRGTTHFPAINDWNSLPGRLLSEKRTASALHLAEAQLRAEPSNVYYLTSLARLYRESGEPQRAAVLFISANEAVVRNRHFYCEWAACEGSSGNNLANAILAGVSISDPTRLGVIEMETAKKSLASLGLAFSRLTKGTRNCPYAKGRRAAAFLGRLSNPDAKAARYFDQYDRDADEVETPHPTDIAEAVAWLEAGVAQAGQENHDSVLAAMAKPGEITFRVLQVTLSRRE